MIVTTMTTTMIMIMMSMTMLSYKAVAIAADPTSYSYSLLVNATTPFNTLGVDTLGEPIIDQCVYWDESVSPENFTWYGFRIQLPDGASTGSGGHYATVTRATKELGLVQPYNTTKYPWGILGYGITTQEAKPTIKMNFNNRLFWNSYTFDFADGDDDYQAFTIELQGYVRCYGSPANATSRLSLMPVIPTLTISLQRDEVDDDNDVFPSPAPTSAAGGVPQAKVLGLTLSTTIAVLALQGLR